MHAFKKKHRNVALSAANPRSAAQVWLVMGDCFFIGLAPVLVHMAKNAQGKYSFHPVAVNLLVECAKLTFATIVLVANVRRSEPHILSELCPQPSCNARVDRDSKSPAQQHGAVGN